ncbi:MAG: hypothetical protein ACLFTD_07650 [Halochromatium sp.]
MLRVVKRGGLIYLNAPSNGSYHGYPFDHWRFYPDAGRALASWSERVGGHPWADNVMVFARQPCAHPLPEPLLCDRLPGATNLRRGDAETLERFQALPEDLRDLKQAQAEVKALQAQLKASQAQVMALSAEVAALQAPQAAPSHDEGATPEAADTFKTAFPPPFLTGYQAGTLRYTYRGLAGLKNPIDLALYAKAIWDLKPRTLIELGSKDGGSAL